MPDVTLWLRESTRLSKPQTATDEDPTSSYQMLGVSNYTVLPGLLPAPIGFTIKDNTPVLYAISHVFPTYKPYIYALIQCLQVSTTYPYPGPRIYGELTALQALTTWLVQSENKDELARGFGTCTDFSLS